ncbi:MAG: MASE3 domain-containing protein [Armatimonadota bacterium]
MILFCIISIIIIQLTTHNLNSLIQADTFLVLHITMESLSIIVSFSLFTIGWYGYTQNKNHQDLLIGIIFLAVGFIDFFHFLSYKGMPDLFSLNNVSKASTYWIIARLISAVGLFISAFVSPTSKNKLLSPSFLLTSSLLLITGITLLITYYLGNLPLMYDQGQGQTILKIVLEWLVICIFVVTILAFKHRGSNDVNIIYLEMALIVAIFSELCFSLYRHPYDGLNFLGHIFKVFAYYLIFRSLFISSFEHPYKELLKAKDRIEISFTRIGDALASSLNIDDTLKLISELAADILGTKYVSVMLIQDGDLYIRAARGLSDYPSKVSTEHSSAGMAIRNKKPVIIGDIDKEIPDHDPDCHCRHIDGPPAASIVSAPIMSGQNVLGVIEVYSPKKNAFGQREASLLAHFGIQSAVAVINSLAYQHERTVAEMLQSSLLHPAPVIPGMDIAVKYVPAEDTIRIGGDLYDIFSLDDSRIAIVVGDVCGHGLEAASTMAMMEYTIRSLLAHGMSVSEALQNANKALIKFEVNATFATMFVSILDIKSFELQFANAGHHMPLIIKGNECSIMPIQSMVPLGIQDSINYPTWTVDLSDATGLLLYTDGIIEARKQKELFGHDRLCELCSSISDKQSNVFLDTIIENVREWAGFFQDDIVLLTVKWDKSGDK